MTTLDEAIEERMEQGRSLRDHEAELNRYIRSHARRAGGSGGLETLRFLVLALCGEAGELANLVKKEWRSGVPVTFEKIVSEMADVANYLDMLAHHLSIDLKRAQLEKFREVGRRPDFKQWGGRQ